MKRGRAERLHCSIQAALLAVMLTPLRHPDLEGVELIAELEVTAGAVSVRAVVHNGGERPVVIMAPPDGKGSPLVDADADGTVVIRDQVVGATTMTPTAPIAIRATVLRPGEERRRETSVARPFVRRWPPGYGNPDAAPLPESPSAVRYCLGIAELALLPGHDAVGPDGALEVAHGNALALEAQRLLCTEPVTLEP